MGIVFSDFGRAKLASGIAAATGVPFTMSLDDGTKFKAYGAGEYEYLVLKDASLNREIIKVNARTGNAFTVIQRAIGPTTARDWSIDDPCEAALTAEGLAALLDNAILTGVTMAAQVNVGGAISTATAGVQNVQVNPGFAAGLSTIPLNTQSICNLLGFGYTVGTTWNLGGAINFRATEDWSATAAGSRIAIRTTPNGSATLRESFSFDQDGGITLPVLGARIRGDFSNTTQTNRITFQTLTADSITSVAAMPSGIGSIGQWQGYNSSDPANCALVTMSCSGTKASLNSSQRGTGIQLPLCLQINGVDVFVAGILGQWGIGGANYGTAAVGAKQSITSGGASAAPSWRTNCQWEDYWNGSATTVDTTGWPEGAYSLYSPDYDQCFPVDIDRTTTSQSNRSCLVGVSAGSPPRFSATTTVYDLNSEQIYLEQIFNNLTTGGLISNTLVTFTKIRRLT